ncbi:MAG: hypothetical protein HZB38_02695 [Planctomycetes bacterium]|nr:hypothetical protein [Planctomycetota bacterium]
MLAICSDLDETPDGDAYFEIQRFLNTNEPTCMGPGVGLEVGNTIYFDMPAGNFCFGCATDAEKSRLRALIDSGHIDCLHSYGDFATTRDHARRALDELRKCRRPLEVWVDHAVAPTNFGADIMRGSGDLPGAPAYHADLTCDYGVQYVWRGRVTSVIGQNRPCCVAGVFDWRHPIASSRTVAKEIAKGHLARRGDAKYAMHASNDLMRTVQLRDGRPVREFLRCNPYWGGVENSDTGYGIADVLTDRFLDRLVARQGFAIVYTHLGKVRSRGELFPEPTRAAFRRLAERQQRGEILVTTTRRLLGYCRAVHEAKLRLSQSPTGERRLILGHPELNAAKNPVSVDDLQGLTIISRDPPAEIQLSDGSCMALRQNPPDETGHSSVSVPWQPLQWPL